MLVHAKTPPIDVEITGKGAMYVLSLLRKSVGDLEITRRKILPSIAVEESSWFEEVSAQVSPGFSLRTYRENAGLTLKKLFEKTGIAISHLSAMENDKRGIGKITAQKLGKALKCNYKRFL